MSIGFKPFRSDMMLSVGRAASEVGIGLKNFGRVASGASQNASAMPALHGTSPSRFLDPVSNVLQVNGPIDRLGPRDSHFVKPSHPVSDIDIGRPTGSFNLDGYSMKPSLPSRTRTGVPNTSARFKDPMSTSIAYEAGPPGSPLKMPAPSAYISGPTPRGPAVGTPSPSAYISGPSMTSNKAAMSAALSGTAEHLAMSAMGGLAGGAAAHATGQDYRTGVLVGAGIGGGASYYGAKGLGNLVKAADSTFGSGSQFSKGVTSTVNGFENSQARRAMITSGALLGGGMFGGGRSHASGFNKDRGTHVGH